MTKHTKEQIDVARRSFNRILDILDGTEYAQKIRNEAINVQKFIYSQNDDKQPQVSNEEALSNLDILESDWCMGIDRRGINDDGVFEMLREIRLALTAPKKVDVESLMRPIPKYNGTLESACANSGAQQYNQAIKDLIEKGIINAE